MAETGRAVDNNVDHEGDAHQLQHAGPPYPVLAEEGGPGPIYQNLVHTHYETPIDHSNQQHEQSGSGQLDKNSMDSYGFNHVYANPSFSGYPEIPAPDYPTDDHGATQYKRRSSDSSRSSDSFSRSEHPSPPTTRRASSPAIQETPPPIAYADHEFHNVPLDMFRPRSDDTVTVTVVPDDNSYWSVGIYSTIAFVSILIVILIIWGLFYYGI